MLYKHFPRREYAETLISGVVRFGSLDYYRSIEDAARGDPTEGTAVARHWSEGREAVVLGADGIRVIDSPGEVTRTSQAGNAVFIVCFTLEPSHSTQKLGKFLVEISDPRVFIDHIRGSLDPSCRWQRNAVVHGWHVEYDKGELCSQEGEHDPLRISVTQKPREYADQKEFRIVLISRATYARKADGTADIPDFLYVKLNQLPLYITGRF